MNLKIDLKKLTLVPSCMMFVLIVATALTLNAVDGMQTASYAMLALVIVDFVFILFLYVREHKVSLISFLSLMFFLLMIVFSAINGTNVKDGIFCFIELSSLIMLMEYYKGNMKMLLVACLVAFSFCVYLNFAYILKNPSWVIAADKDAHGYPLGGNYNQFGCRMICAIITNIICLKFSKKWLFNLIPLVLVCIVSLGIVASMTSLGCIVLFLIIYLIPSAKIKKLALASVVTIVLLFQFAIVFNGNGIENNDAARYIVEDVMGKDITFTKRTEKWETGMNAFYQSPVIGYGMVDEKWYLTHMVSEGVGPHNYLINVLINGGIVLMALFVLIFALVLKKIKRPADSTMLNLLLALSLLFTMMLMEVYPYIFVFYMLLLICYYPEIKASSISTSSE
ncbi:MAG: O-antigen ligase family protein [Prevotellaceae bacterium]|nr:O-antigen ligase family protein [Prevotellaceae bacterium]